MMNTPEIYIAISLVVLAVIAILVIFTIKKEKTKTTFQTCNARYVFSGFGHYFR